MRHTKQKQAFNSDVGFLEHLNMYSCRNIHPPPPAPTLLHGCGGVRQSASSYLNCCQGGIIGCFCYSRTHLGLTALKLSLDFCTCFLLHSRHVLLTGSCHRRPLGGSNDPAIVKPDTEEEKAHFRFLLPMFGVIVNFTSVFGNFGKTTRKNGKFTSLERRRQNKFGIKQRLI